MQRNNFGLASMLSCIGIAPIDFTSQDYTFDTLTELTLDSRQANQNTVFLAVYGSQTSGHSFLESAADAGCKIALVETRQAHENGLIKLQQFTSESSLVCIYVHALGSILADIAYSFYSDNSEVSSAKKLPNITAITGTNGKTSVASLIAQLASLCDQKSASIGTLGVNKYSDGIQSKFADTINTTPDIITLISILSRLQKEGCKQVTLEASSHGLEQNRLQKLNVNCAVFTNLTQDHLDYHQTMEAYGKAKRELLKVSGITKVILNADDTQSQSWQAELIGKQEVFWYSLRQLDKNHMGCWASNINYSTAGIHFTLHAKFPSFDHTASIDAKLIGAFNVANLLAAVTALLAQKFSFSDIKGAITQLSSVAGRMELFENAKASLLVDYAHTPDALKQALIAARVHTRGRLSCIFGCGGDRDTSKRALMGAIAVQYADNIVLTQDNSRSEDPLNIIADIKKGLSLLSPEQKLSVVLDREQAILSAWEGSQKDDMILVAGKGHEDYIEINNTRIDYNEREVVAALTNRHPVSDYVRQYKGGEQ